MLCYSSFLPTSCSKMIFQVHGELSHKLQIKCTVWLPFDSIQMPHESECHSTIQLSPVCAEKNFPFGWVQKYKPANTAFIPTGAMAPSSLGLKHRNSVSELYIQGGTYSNPWSLGTAAASRLYTSPRSL